jgi:hypothetical protein
MGPAPALAAAFKDATLVVAVTVSTVPVPALTPEPELTPTPANGTEDDGAVEGTTVGVGLTASGGVTLGCLVDCKEVAAAPLLEPRLRGLLRSLAPPAASFIVAVAGSG